MNMNMSYMKSFKNYATDYLNNKILNNTFWKSVFYCTLLLACIVLVWQIVSIVMIPLVLVGATLFFPLAIFLGGVCFVCGVITLLLSPILILIFIIKRIFRKS